MDSHLIRPARPKDAQQLRSLLTGFTSYAADVDESDYLNRFLARVDDPTWCLVVAEDDGGLIGYAIAQDFGRNLGCRFTTGRVDDLYVDPAQRRHGVGEALMHGALLRIAGFRGRPHGRLRRVPRILPRLARPVDTPMMMYTSCQATLAGDN